MAPLLVREDFEYPTFTFITSHLSKNPIHLKLGGFREWDFPINGWYVLSHDMLYIKMSNPPSLH